MEALLVVLIVAVVAFVVLRAFWLWFWKIDEGVGLLKEIRDSLRAGNGAATVPTVETSAGGNKLKCPACGQFVRPNENSLGKQCPYDGTVIARTITLPPSSR